MSRIKLEKAKEKQGLVGKLRFFRFRNSNENSRLGLLTFFVTISLIVAGVSLSGGFGNESKAQSVDPPVDAVNVSAFSTSWSCPIAGDPSQDDLVILTNADSDRSAQVKVMAHASDGAVLGRKNVDVPKLSSIEVALSDITDKADASLYIESFAGSVVPFRVLNLSDGIEFVQCKSATSAVKHYLGIQTLRNSNAELVLSNPYAQAVVVDITAQFLDGTVDPPRAGLGETRGVIISARGRTSINLQQEYGRYSQLNLKVSARSGFFVGEVLQTFDGLDDIFGQTIIGSSSALESNKKSFVPGARADFVSGYNDTATSQSVSLEAFSNDNRFVSLEPQSMIANSQGNFEVPGQDFLPRMLAALLESAESQDSQGVFGSWLSRRNNAVASGDLLHKQSQAFVLPARGEDILYLYNPSKDVANVTIKYSKDVKDTKIEVKGQSFIAIPIDFTDPNTSVMLTLSSDKRISVGISNDRQSRYSSGINLAP